MVPKYSKSARLLAAFCHNRNMDWTGVFNLLVRKKKRRKMVRINWLVGSSDEIMKIIKINS